MSNILEFVIKFKDQMSTGIAGIGANVERTFSRIDARSRQVGNSIQGINTRLDALQRTRDISFNLRDIRQANREITALERQRDRLTNSGNRSGGMMGTLAGGAVVAGGGMLLRESVLQATKQQGIEDAIRFSMGNNSGNAMLSHIKEKSNTLGLDQMSSLEGAKTFLGATRGKLNEKDQVRTFDAVGEAISTFKLSGEDAKGVFLALGQIASKGTVSAEELRGQIGERLPGAFSLAAKAMGVTEAKLGDMMQKGELAANVFLPKFATELHKTFGVEAINSSDSAQANFNRLTNSLNDLKNKIGTELLPAMAPFIQMLIQVFSWISANIAPILGFATGIGVVVGVVKAWTIAQRILNVVMIANPIGIIIGVIGILIGAVVAIIAKFGGWRNAWDALVGTFYYSKLILVSFFKDIGDAIATGIEIGYYKAIGWLDEMINKLKNVGETAAYYMSFGAMGEDKWNATTTVSPYTQYANELSKARDKRSADNHALANQSLANIGTIWQTKKGKESTSTGYEWSGKATADALAGGKDAKDAKNKVGSDVNGITGGGTRNVYINLGKFQDAINIYVQNTKDGVDRLQEHVEDAFLRVLNSAGQ